MKQTIDHRWAHLFCTFWIDGACVSNPVLQEPIDHSAVQKARFKLVCCVCRKKMGAPIQCSHRLCRIAYHTTCAREAGLYFDRDTKTSFCPKHTPDDHVPYMNIERPNWVDSDEEEETFEGGKRKKKRRRHDPLVWKRRPFFASTSSQISHAFTTVWENSSVSISPMFLKAAGGVLPVIPSCILTRIVLHHIHDWQMKNKTDVVITVCKYWALKREQRKGVSLLKRLHLEPWTVKAPQTSNQLIVDRLEKEHEKFSLIRADLEKLRMLLELVRKREREKLKRLQVLDQISTRVFMPVRYFGSQIIQTLERMDTRKLFAFPVTREIAPDYFDVIQTPMDFETINKKLSSLEYESLADLQKDAELICTNAMTYNRPETIYYKSATKIKQAAKELFEGSVHSSAQVNWHDLFDFQIEQEPEPEIVQSTPIIFSSPAVQVSKGIPINGISIENPHPEKFKEGQYVWANGFPGVIHESGDHYKVKLLTRDESM